LKHVEPLINGGIINSITRLHLVGYLSCVKIAGLVIQPAVGLLEVNTEHEHNEHSSIVWMMQGFLFLLFAYIRIIFGCVTE
jgi:hypothetical protein